VDKSLGGREYDEFDEWRSMKDMMNSMARNRGKGWIVK
jgi:hypothetical protein